MVGCWAPPVCHPAVWLPTCPLPSVRTSSNGTQCRISGDLRTTLALAGGSSTYQQGVLTLLLVSTYFRVLAREFGYWYYYVSSLKKKKNSPGLSLNKKSLDFPLEWCSLNRWHTGPPLWFWCPLTRASFPVCPARAAHLQHKGRSRSLPVTCQ